MDSRTIVDYAIQDDASKMREALYAAIYDKVNGHMEAKKREIAQTLVGQQQPEVEPEVKSTEEVTENQE